MPAGNPVIVRRDGPSDDSSDPQNLEVVAGHQLPFDPLGLALVTETQWQRVTAQHAAEYLAFVADVLVQRIRQGVESGVAAVMRALPSELHELFRIFHRQQP